MSILIRHGLLVDGSGSQPRAADVLIVDGKINRIADAGTIDVGSLGFDVAEQIDASNCIVTPGFIDPHTHYDGQATWDDRLAPSADHGITTLVMGNCGVGFAPVKPGDEDFLVDLMEGVEDIPGAALSDGIDWRWESFPQYLDVLAEKKRATDIVTQVPHGALRAYVLGKDSDMNAKATPEQIETMARLAKEAVAAGAFAFSSNRIAMHTSTSGVAVPGTFAEKDEVRALIEAVQQAGANLLQVVPEGLMGENPEAYRDEVQLYGELSLETGAEVLFTMAQNNVQTTLWREALDSVELANNKGAKVHATTGNRPGGMLMSWDTFNIFMDRASYLEIAHLPLAQRVLELQKPTRRAAILADETQSELLKNGAMVVMHALAAIYLCTDKQIFEPDPKDSLAVRLANTEDSAEAVLYDAMCEVAQGETPGFLHVYMGNYADGDLEAVREMMSHPAVLVGAADGGAHVNVICDASYTTYMLQHWVRDRERGQRLPLAQAVQMMTQAPAELYGLSDRGVLAEGKKADINVINLQQLQLHKPWVANDLPTGAPRLLQAADGYVATIVSGEVTVRDGQDTGARPGGLVRRQALA